MQTIRHDLEPNPNRSKRRRARRDMEAQLRSLFPPGAPTTACVTCGEPTPMSAYIEGIDECQCGRSSNHDPACRRPRCPRCYSRVMMQTR